MKFKYAELLSKKNILFLLVFFYVNFPFSFASIHLYQDIAVLGISCMIILLNVNLLYRRFTILEPGMLLPFVLFGLLAAFSIIYPLLIGTNDNSFFRIIYFSSIQLIITHLALTILFVRLYKEEATFNKLAYFYLLTCCLYLVTTFILVLIPSLKEAWISNLYISETDIEHLSKPQYASRVGIDGFSGFKQTFKFSVGIVLAVYMMIDKIKKFKRVNWMEYIILVMLVSGTLLYGRIGSVVAAIALVVLICYYFTKPRALNVAFGIILSGIIMLMLIFLLSSVIDPLRTWMEWAFELFISFFRSGEFTSTSTEILFEKMYFVPDIKSFFVGNALFTDPVTGSYFMGTDVGILRSILFYGILPTAVIYSLVLHLIGKVSHHLNRSKLFFFLMTTLFIVFEIKGGVYHYMFPTLLPFYLTLRYQQNALMGKEMKVY